MEHIKKAVLRQMFLIIQSYLRNGKEKNSNKQSNLLPNTIGERRTNKAPLGFKERKQSRINKIEIKKIEKINETGSLRK